MSTLLTLALSVIAVVVVYYLFTTLPDSKGLGKGKCSEKDYEIADKLAEKKN